jgi:hypothetical protein
MVQSRLSWRALEGRSYWHAWDPTPRGQHRIDLIQCYDEIIISYRQTRDILRTPRATFPVPGNIDGFQHILLLDGRLLGHWRARTGKDGVRVETRTAFELDQRERAALVRSVDRYERFLRDQREPDR